MSRQPDLRAKTSPNLLFHSILLKDGNAARCCMYNEYGQSFPNSISYNVSLTFLLSKAGEDIMLANTCGLKACERFYHRHKSELMSRHVYHLSNCSRFTQTSESTKMTATHLEGLTTLGSWTRNERWKSCTWLSFVWSFDMCSLYHRDCQEDQ